MKRFVSFLSAVCLAAAVFGQSQRLVMLEEFTSATCGPCVSKNTQFHTWQTQNPDKFTSIYYHVNWPSPGDPMNLANPSENGARVSYYMSPGNQYVPYSVLDGNYYNGSAGGWSMSTINTRWAVPSPFEIQLQHKVSAGNDSAYSNILVKCTQAITASMTVHNVIIEKWIHFNSAPCANSNGERDFYWVMKKMLPGSNGTTIPGSMAVGDYILIEGAWKFGTVYDPTQIASVGFVQDKSTKEIYQSANSSTDIIVMPYNNDLQVMEVTNVPAKTCIDKVTPIIKIRNNGKTTVTSFTIKYKMNEGPLQSFTWNGSLSTLQKQMVTLPELGFPILPANVLTVYTESPNSVADEYPKNDTLHFNVAPAPISTNQIKLVLRTDNSPQETTWNITGSAGNIVASGGPYTVPNQLLQQTYTLPQADCYKFTIFDAGGNGICCTNGTGVYEISSSGTIIKQGGQFGASESSEFLMAAPVGIETIQGEVAVTVYPNPVSGDATISYDLPAATDVQLQVLSSLGQQVMSESLGFNFAGTHETRLSTANLRPGVYFVVLKTSRGTVSRKMTVVR